MNKKINHRLTEKGLNFKSEYPDMNLSQDFILENEPFIKKTDFNSLYKIDIEEVWEKKFIIKLPIKYSTTVDATERTGYLNDNSIKKKSGREKIQSSKKPADTNFIEHYETKSTGYVIPEYTFIQSRLKHGLVRYREHNEGSKVYNDTLNLFKLKKKNNVPVNKYTEICNYRNTLHSQLERQANKVWDILPTIKRIFKIHYFESERAITFAKMKAQSKEEINILESHWGNIENGLVKLFYSDIQSGVKLKNIATTYDDIQIYDSKFQDKSDPEDALFSHFLISENKYVPENIMEQTMQEFYQCMNKIDRINGIAQIFAEKIIPLESILEDFFLNREIKSYKGFIESFDMKLTKHDIFKKAQDYKESGMIVSKMYEEIKNWLFDDLKLTNQELKARFGFELKDPNHFNRTVNKNRSHPK